MKGKQIVSVRCHIGVYQFAGQQALNKERLGKECSMELNALGVLVKAKMGDHMKQVLVPFANIIGIEMEDEK